MLDGGTCKAQEFLKMLRNKAIQLFHYLISAYILTFMKLRTVTLSELQYKKLI